LRTSFTITMSGPKAGNMCNNLWCQMIRGRKQLDCGTVQKEPYYSYTVKGSAVLLESK
jgi:hypothetical protein